MKITVIVPIYKVEKYLAHCVDSILAQTYTDLEVILVDDGSPDGCPAMCDAYAAKDSRIKVIHQQNGGVSAARNAGLDAATGEYIGFVDADDTIEPSLCAALADDLEHSGADISSCLVGPGDLSGIDQHPCSRAVLIELLLGKPWSTAGVTAKLFRRGVLHGLYFDTQVRIMEDVQYLIRVLCRCKALCRETTGGYNVTARADSAMRTPLEERIFDALLQAQRIRAEILKYFPTDVELQACADWYLADGYERILIYMCTHPAFRRKYPIQYHEAVAGWRGSTLTLKDIRRLKGTKFMIYAGAIRVAPRLGIFLYYRIYVSIFKRK